MEMWPLRVVDFARLTRPAMLNRPDGPFTGRDRSRVGRNVARDLCDCVRWLKELHYDVSLFSALVLNVLLDLTMVRDHTSEDLPLGS